MLTFKLKKRRQEKYTAKFASLMRMDERARDLLDLKQEAMELNTLLRHVTRAREEPLEPSYAQAINPSTAVGSQGCYIPAGQDQADEEMQVEERGLVEIDTA